MDSNLTLHSKYYIDCTGHITEDAYLTVSGGRIHAVAQKKQNCGNNKLLELGDCFLIPGLVNAHTHLDLTLTHNKISRHALFTDWLRDLIRITFEWDEEYYGRSIQEGFCQSIAAGTTTIGDIVRKADTNIYSHVPIRARLFFEVINFDPLTAEETLASLNTRLDIPNRRGLETGISPHTPYSVSEKLLEDCARLSHSKDIPLCIHLSETEAEVEFLQKGTGEILAFREDFGLPHQWTPPRKSPVKYVEELGLLDRPAALIHCNYLNDEEVNIIAESNSSVVFCPGSHRFFGHRPHRVRQMLDKGINVALGSDSLASNDCLSLLKEMNTVRNDYRDIAPHEILRMATVNGLKALAFAEEFDAAESGCLADLTGVTVAAKEMERVENPLDALFSDSAQAVFSMTEGRILLNTVESGVDQN